MLLMCHIHSILNACVCVCMGIMPVFPFSFCPSTSSIALNRRNTVAVGYGLDMLQEHTEQIFVMMCKQFALLAQCTREFGCYLKGCFPFSLLSHFRSLSFT